MSIGSTDNEMNKLLGNWAPSMDSFLSHYFMNSRMSFTFSWPSKVEKRRNVNEKAEKDWQLLQRYDRRRQGGHLDKYLENIFQYFEISSEYPKISKSLICVGCFCGTLGHRLRWLQPIETNELSTNKSLSCVLLYNTVEKVKNKNSYESDSIIVMIICGMIISQKFFN